MNKLVGMKWYQLTKELKSELYSKKIVVDAKTGLSPKHNGPCIIKFEGTNLTIAGNCVVGEEILIEIEDNAIIYNFDKGAINNWVDRIKIVRKYSNMTQQDVSKMLRIPIRTIKDWERGARVPSEWVQDLIIEKINSIKK
ncbi:MAG: helix-turn-helix domain-containing protein [Clostridiales bacterium]|nr:helix-turn-helix domain-containing protein [Clostridiales bacterium]